MPHQRKDAQVPVYLMVLFVLTGFFLGFELSKQHSEKAALRANSGYYRHNPKTGWNEFIYGCPKSGMDW